MPDVLAAGGVMSDGAGRVLLVHRPKYDDWTFPKGKLDAGETLEECAKREVEEETGCGCHLGDHIIQVAYVDHKGRDKTVDYWAMTPLQAHPAEDFEPNDEVDAIRWVEPDQVEALLTYERDRDVWAAARRQHG